ncbi:MAG: TonB family protein [Endomicrobium sp.]|jgi:protein TonB|nr:TonB family protein [Endomicrobium sp.]
MMKKQKNAFPYILVSIAIHILIFCLIFYQGKSRELPDLVEVSFYSPTPLPDPEIHPKEEPKAPEIEEKPKEIPKLVEEVPKDEPPKRELQKKETLKKKKIVSDEKSDIKVADDDDAIQPEDLKVDAEIFKFPQYARSIQKKIAEAWKHDKWNNLRVEVFFRIHRDGLVSGVRIKKSSGNASFDENGVNTIIKAAPFDKLPDGFANNKLRFIFVFQKGIV